MHNNRTFFRILFLLVMITFSGCSRVKIAYNYADWIIAAKVNSTFQLDNSQEQIVDEELKKFFAWHRKSMLPGFATYFNEQAEKIRASNFNNESYEASRDGFLALYYGTMEGAYPGMARLLLTLSDAQIANYEKIVEIGNKEAEIELARDQTVVQNERAETTVQFLRKWVGYIPEAQQTKIANITKELIWPRHEWYARRKANQKRFSELLKKGSSAEVLISQLKEIFQDPKAGASPALNKKMDEFNKKATETAVAILKTLDGNQRNYLAEKMNGLAEDFADLSKQ